MNKSISITIGLLLILCLSASINAAEYEIKMLDRGVDGQMVFEPGFLQVEVGDTVTFIPAGHEHDSISVLTPPGANTWHGRRNQKVSVVINKEGVYIYKCAPHFYFGMVGVIQAGRASNLNEAEAVAAEISARFITNKKRLVDYLTKVK